MRAIHAAVLGGVVGAGLGAVLAGLLRSPAQDQDVAPGRTRAPKALPAGPALEGRAAGDSARDLRATLALDLARHGRSGLPSGICPNPLQSELWRAAVGALLLLADPEPGFAALEAALAAGVTPDEIGSLLPLLSPARAHEVLRWLHPLLEGRAASAWLAARAAEAAGGNEQAFERGLEALRSLGPDFSGTVALLLRVDRERAVRAVKALAAESRWNETVLGAVAEGFRTVVGDEAAQAWHDEAGRRRAQDAEVRIADLRRAAEAAPTDPDVWLNLAHELREADHREDAVAVFMRILQLDPLDEEAVQRLAELDLAAAAPFLEAMARGVPSAEIFVWLARAKLRTFDATGAMDALLRLPSEALDEWWRNGAAALSPAPALKHLDARLQSARARRSGLLHSARGDALAALGRTSEAFEACAEAIRMGNATGYDFDGDDTVRRMVALDPAGTAAFFDALPSDPQGLREHARARSEAAQGRTAAWRAFLERVTQSSADWRPEGAAVLGSPWRGRLEQEERERPDSSSHADVARMYELRGQLAEARAAYDRALALVPENTTWVVRRALLR